MQPFQVKIPDSALDDLRRRLSATRWPAELPGVGWTRGVPRDYLQDLAEYWRTSYDWRAAEAMLNSFPQFTTEIDGTQVHFLHVRSPEPGAVPLLLVHGWPSSVVEFTDVIGPLTDPRAHGGNPEIAFHVVVPSLPGFGFSGAAPEPGWDLPRMAGAMAELMRRLSYSRYLAQGGDFGSSIALILSQIDREHLLGAHVNMLPTVPDLEAIPELDEADQARVVRLGRLRDDLSGYMRMQATRPQTLAYGLTDSPVGQLAWIVEKFREWTDSTRVPEDAVSRDQLLTNVMIYWLTATAGSSAQVYYESAAMLPTAEPPPGPPSEPNDVPLGVAVFPHDPVLPVRRFAERDFTNIVQWSEFDRGGHFAAMEEPDLLVADIRKFAAQLQLQSA